MITTYSQCVSVALVIQQHAKRMRRITVYCHPWPVRLRLTFPRCFINGTIFYEKKKKEKSLKIKCAFWFSLQLLSATFLILRRTGREIITNELSLQVKCPLFLTDFNETWIFPTDFEKKKKTELSYFKKICLEEAEMFHWRTDGRTDRHDEANSRFSQFC